MCFFHFFIYHGSLVSQTQVHTSLLIYWVSSGVVISTLVWPAVGLASILGRGASGPWAKSSIAHIYHPAVHKFFCPLKTECSYLIDRGHCALKCCKNGCIHNPPSLSVLLGDLGSGWGIREKKTNETLPAQMSSNGTTFGILCACWPMEDSQTMNVFTQCLLRAIISETFHVYYRFWNHIKLRQNFTHKNPFQM